MTEPLVIEQDHEFDEMDGIGSSVAVFWSRGHDHDVEEFIRAVLDHCLNEGSDIPAIRTDDSPTEVWQTELDRGGVAEFRRTEHHSRPVSDWYPVTVLDVERRPTFAGIKCMVIGCGKPCARPREPARAVVGRRQPIGAMPVRFWLCHEHGDRFPGSSYQVFLVPIEATGGDQS